MADFEKFPIEFDLSIEAEQDSWGYQGDTWDGPTFNFTDSNGWDWTGATDALCEVKKGTGKPEISTLEVDLVVNSSSSVSIQVTGTPAQMKNIKEGVYEFDVQCRLPNEGDRIVTPVKCKWKVQGDISD